MVVLRSLFVTLSLFVGVPCALSDNDGKCFGEGCALYYDGCNDLTCDRDGNILSQTWNYCKHSYEPENAHCKVRHCPVQGCALYYDGCNDISCNADELIIDQTWNYCKHPIYKPENARCKAKLCPPTCKRFFDGCNKYECEKTGVVGNLLEPEVTCDTYKAPKCTRYKDCNKNRGWTRSKKVWCCKIRGKHCGNCPGMSGTCKKNGGCKTAGHTCREMTFNNKPLKVCCPSDD